MLQLSQSEILPGSENVVLEVRDRRNPELIISREPLSRSVDYNLDVNTGVIFLLSPISTFDYQLNLIQVVVTYEHSAHGLASSVYTGRLTKQFSKLGLRMGATFVNQRQPESGPFYLGGIDLEKSLPRDLADDGVTVNDGTKSGALANSGMDTPIFTTRQLIGTTLTLAGYVGSASGQSTFAAATVQFSSPKTTVADTAKVRPSWERLPPMQVGTSAAPSRSSAVWPGDRITGTATDGTNNTSEFGFNAYVNPPAVSLLQSVLPSGTQPPGTDLVFSFAFTNVGGIAASTYIITDQIPPCSDFKVGSATTNLGTTGLTITVAYSNDNSVTWTYTPVSGGGGALAGYDRAVTHVRWSFTGNLSQASPNDAGSISITARIR